MKGLKCTTNNCEHNDHDHCMAGIIDISESAVCKTKLKREGGTLSQIFAEYEAAPDIEMLEDVETVVQCDADCVYNTNRMCSRENLNIEDSVIRTKCFSRKKPV
ncbi:MAG: DUF1540 domain-containing protein [Clostridia bacterium]|nr:DUF1540 domain-containing protein [Clostridia bacterium]